MFTLFLIGNIASGKSTAARYLEGRGARRIDLDTMAKDLYVPGSDVVHDLAEAFGYDILAADGGIAARVLAQRAFSSPEQTALLNSIVHPVLLRHLSDILLPVNCCSTVVPRYPLTVVEVSAAASFRAAFDLADEIIAVTASCEIRRARALERGMSPDDFDARSEVQPSEEELCSMADAVLDNTKADDSLFAALDAWLASKNIYLSTLDDVSHA